MYKNNLQEWCQSKGVSLPKYNSHLAGGLAHLPQWSASVTVLVSTSTEMSFISEGVYSSKKEAEMSAAKGALDYVTTKSLADNVDEDYDYPIFPDVDYIFIDGENSHSTLLEITDQKLKFRETHVFFSKYHNQLSRHTSILGNPCVVPTNSKQISVVSNLDPKSAKEYGKIFVHSVDSRVSDAADVLMCCTAMKVCSNIHKNSSNSFATVALFSNDHFVEPLSLVLSSVGCKVSTYNNFDDFLRSRW